MNSDDILVTGGTGKVGFRVAERLRARGLPVRIGSRGAVPPFDWSDRATWEAAVRGAGAMYLTYYPDLALDGAAGDVRAFADVAIRNGTRRIVLLSGRGEEGAQRAEDALRETGVEWTVVRCSWFMQNFSEGFFWEPLVMGDVALPVGDVSEPFIDADDIADVVVEALTADGHAGRVYELTGPRLLTFGEAVETIAAAAGRAIGFASVPHADYEAMMREAAVPPEFVELMMYLFREVLDGRNAFVTGDVERVLGRAPRDFREFARDAAAAGAWTEDAVAASAAT